MENNTQKSLNDINNKFYSVELCSTKSLSLELLPSLNPLFYSITWHQTHFKKPMENPALFIAAKLANEGKNVLLHLPCRYLSKQNLCDILSYAKQHKIKNIFALQGDPLDTEKSIDFYHAIDLVHFIKQNFGNNFTICVAGYPLGHPEASNLSEDLRHLKEKVNAGADFIITQMIFNINIFHEFYKSCRAVGINVPIIPGVYIINSYDSLKKLTKICRVYVPEKILNDIESIKNNSLALQNYGLQQATELINNLLKGTVCPVNTIHLFSLNDIHVIVKFLKNITLFE